jgi:hypothetical protein
MQGIGGFADYYGQTQVDALGLIVTIVLACLVFWLPRRYALLPLLAAATSLPIAQRLVIVGADFTLLRLLLLAYVARIIFRREWVELTWNRLDSAIILWVVSGTTITTIHYGSFDALINRLGWAFDIIIVYFASRIVMRQWDDIRALGKGAALISIPMGVPLSTSTSRCIIYSAYSKGLAQRRGQVGGESVLQGRSPIRSSPVFSGRHCCP